MRVFRPGRVGATVALVLLTAVATSGPALAQTAIELGGNATISNGTECAANVRAQVYLSLGEAESLPLGSVTTDPEGHFEVSVPIPSNLSTGAATILIDCGISGSLLTYDVELQNGSSRIFSLDLGTLVVYGAALLAIAFILHVAFECGAHLTPGHTDSGRSVLRNSGRYARSRRGRNWELCLKK